MKIIKDEMATLKREAAQAEHEADKVIIEYHEATIKRLEARQWVGLSEKEKERLSDLSADPRWNAWIGMEQTEALLKEKNT